MMGAAFVGVGCIDGGSEAYRLSKTSMPSYCPKCEEYDAFVVVYVTNPFHFLLNLSIPNNRDNADFVRIPINSKMVKLSLFIGGTYTFCSLLGT